jgi:hypothetical protein
MEIGSAGPFAAVVIPCASSKITPYCSDRHDGGVLVTLNSNDLMIELDLDAVRKAGDRVRTRLLRLRREFDLTPFEYTRRVRIAPLEIPHSHPVLTLNTRTEDDHALLCTYIHEQMHWYLWRLGSPSLDPISPSRCADGLSRGGER